MSLVPVLDIKDGQVVSGEQGNRESYQPINSDLCDTSNPKEVLNSVKEACDFSTVYMADIDSLLGQGDNVEVVREISDGFELDLMLDPGFQNLDSLNSRLPGLVDLLIVASESLESLEELSKLEDNVDSCEICVSVDIMDGEFKSDFGDLEDFVSSVLDMGVKTLVVLDISQVGTEEGISRHVSRTVSNLPDEVRVFSGGGVRGPEDYESFRSAGVDEVLVSTALHKNREIL